jgi:hypothetical protein
VIMNLTPDSCQITGEKVDKCTTTPVNPYHLRIPFANEQDARIYADNLKHATQTCAGATAQPVIATAGAAPSLYAAAAAPAVPIPDAAPTAPMPSVAYTAATPAPSAPAPSASAPAASAPAASAILHIIRNSSTAGGLHPFVLIDQKRTTQPLNHQTVKMLVPPGKHTISVGDSDVTSSEIPDLVMEAGKEYWVKLNLSVGGWKVHAKLTVENPEAAKVEAAKFIEINFGEAFKD